MKDKNGIEIKSGMKVKHIHHPKVESVRLVGGELIAGQVKLSAYHYSVIEVIDEQSNKARS